MPPKDTISQNILDNLSQNSKLGNFLQQTIRPNAELSIVSAYFTIHAFHALRPQLESISKLRFLFGEPTFLKNDLQNPHKSFNIQEDNLELSQHLQQKAIAKACADWIRDKVEIKTVNKPDFLHAKLYFIKNPPDAAEDHRLYSVVGSSNFTVNGLGFGKTQQNLELNLITDSRHDVEDLGRWFDKLWKGQHQEVVVSDVKTEVLAYLEQLYRENSPDFIYHKTLFHLFHTDIALDTPLPPSLEKSEIWNKLYEFQKNAVRQIIYKMSQYDGCILADSVGLGKTFTALAVIKYFESRNKDVLVLSPKKLRGNWNKYRRAARDTSNVFVNDHFHYTLLSHTDLTRNKGKVDAVDLEKFNWDAYDLVVIDESHHFRNATKSYEKQGSRAKSRYEKLLEEVIKAGAKTKVLLLSATPVNNNLLDLLNQIRLIAHDNDAAFQESMRIESLTKTLRSAQKTLDDHLQKPASEKSSLIDTLDKKVAVLLDNLTIARSRQQIKTYFADSIQKLGNFPQRQKPQNEYIEIESLRYSDLVEKINSYKLSLFNPSSYLLPEYQEFYVGKVKNFEQNMREHFLIGMMRVNFLKRLESSIFSFSKTLQRTLDKIGNLQQKLAEAQSIEWQSLETNDLQQELEDENQDFEWGKLSFKVQHLDVANWLADLQQDEQQLTQLLADVKNVPEDSKLQKLHQLIRAKVTHPPLNPNNRKILIFTAFADTATYLYENTENLAKALNVHIALVTGSGRNQSSLKEKDFEKLLTYFSPLSRERNLLYPQETREIDILIATDCISEGQNLQDCDYVVNYDIHWNPVRIIQRFGRIDRLGSRNQAIQMVNFWAGKDLEGYLQLEARVKARMELVSATTTTDENLLEEQVQQEKEKNYRDHQLLLFKEHVPELETEGVQLEELSFTAFRLALQARNEAELENAPLGMYAVVPETEAFEAGVIFCLKLLDKEIKMEKLNQLHPYFLVYVKKRDNTIHYHFSDIHQILTMFEALCFGKTAIYQEGCSKFDQETQHGSDMKIYNTLLQTALASFGIETVKQATHSMTKNRAGRLFKQEELPATKTKFELITWLVIQEAS
jgi:superfamily II DNA or RNA helicase